MADWSLEAAADAFFRRFPDEPRNMYEKAPDVLRRHYGDEFAQAVLNLVPPHSNDYYLDATAADIVSLLPPELADDADQVFVARTPTLEVNAEAMSLAADARVAFVYQGLSTAIGLYGFLLRRTYHMIVGLDRSSAYGVGDVVRLAYKQLPALLEDPQVALVLERRRQWINGVDLDDDLESLLGKWSERLASGVFSLNEIHDLGEHFVVAHEIAHHLLGHTHERHFPFRLHPATLHLRKLRAALGVELDDGYWSEAQIAEFDADAFAFLTLAGEVATPGAFQNGRWYGAIIGALLALPALEDVALAAAATEATTLRAAHTVAGATHPPIAQRVGQVVKLVLAFPESSPDQETLGHPIGLLAQFQVFIALLATSREQDSLR